MASILPTSNIKDPLKTLKNGLRAVFHCSRFARAGGALYCFHKYLNCKVDKHNERCARAGKTTSMENGLQSLFLRFSSELVA